MNLRIKLVNDQEKLYILNCQRVIVISKSDRKSLDADDIPFYHFDTNNDYIFESDNMVHIPGKRIEYIVVSQ